MEQTQTIEAASSAEVRTPTRWIILAMLFAITTINYADRATMSIAAPGIRKELGLDAVQMGFVFSAFAWSYLVAQLPGGWLLDRFGSRITYFFSIFLWSVFTMMTGAAGFVAGGAAVTLLFTLRLLVFVGANAALAIACHLFIVGDIKRVALTRSLVQK